MHHTVTSCSHEHHMFMMLDIYQLDTTQESTA